MHGFALRKLLIAVVALVLCSCQTAQAAGFGFSGFGFDHHQPHPRGGSGGGVVGGGITAPTLAQTSSAGTTPFTWDVTFDATVYAGFNEELQTSTHSDFSSIDLQDLTKQIPESEMAGDPADWSTSAFNPPYDSNTGAITGFVTWSGQAYMRERIKRDDGLNSPWSNTIGDNISSNQSKYWRLRTSATQNNNSVNIAEITYRTIIGNSGSAVTPTGVVASSTFSTDVAANAIDGNNATEWDASSAPPGTLDATFSSAIEAKEITITASANGGNTGDAPKDFKLQKCTDATFTSCTDYLTVTGQLFWSVSEVRTFH